MTRLEVHLNLNKVRKLAFEECLADEDCTEYFGDEEHIREQYIAYIDARDSFSEEAKEDKLEEFEEALDDPDQLSFYL